jgi:hypothetical protein
MAAPIIRKGLFAGPQPSTSERGDATDILPSPIHFRNGATMVNRRQRTSGFQPDRQFGKDFMRWDSFNGESC